MDCSKLRAEDNGSPYMDLRAKTGGRQKGTPNKRTVEVQERLEALGCDPIEGMARIAMDETAAIELRGRMYAELAQYVAPKRKAIEVEATGGGLSFVTAKPVVSPERPSLQAHVVDAIVRLTVKRRINRARDPRKMREALEAAAAPRLMNHVKLPKAALFRTAELAGVPGEWVSWEGVTPRATLLYLHGGGHVACSPRTHRPITAGFARRGLNVFAPDYRLAPEHPFPAAIDDAVAVWRDLLARAGRAAAVRRRRFGRRRTDARAGAEAARAGRAAAVWAGAVLSVD